MPIHGDYYRHVTKRIAVCADHSCQIEHVKDRVQGKELCEFLADRLCDLPRDMLLDIALQYYTEQELCEWFFSGPYIQKFAYEDDDDEDDYGTPIAKYIRREDG